MAIILRLAALVKYIFSLAKELKPKLDFEGPIFRCGIVKILVNPKGLTAFLPRTPKNWRPQNSATPKAWNFVMIFGAEEKARPAPAFDEKPKNAEITRLWGGFGF